MKILLVNNHHQYSGGSEKYYLDLGRLLHKHGHQVAYFSMQAPDNTKTKWSKYFVSNINFKNKSLSNYLKIIFRSIYSFESKSHISRLLTDFKPDIVHINNIYYYLSPSILAEITRRHIPIIQTVHDYQLISPTTNLFHQGKIYEKTKTHKYYTALLDRSPHESLPRTLLAVTVSYFQYIFNLFPRSVNTFISPSLFVKNKLVEYGFNKQKLIHLPNFVNSQTFNSRISSDDYILFFGRITENKGVLPILQLAAVCPELKFKIVGRFTDPYIESQVYKNIRSLSNVQLVPHLGQKSLRQIIQKSRFVIVPSLWYENQPYSILESYSLGKAVIASKIGGIPEIVLPGKTGLLFNPDDFSGFKAQVLTLWHNKQLARKLGHNAYKYVSTFHNPENYYRQLIKIYSGLIK